MRHGDVLPSGIVTFVFTDIEGSTRLLRHLGDGYSDVLDRHLELLATAWDAHDGHVLDTAGDGAFVAFQDATAAVAACAQAQRLLVAEPWPERSRPKVRIGLHTGLAAPHRREYRALAVHQASRVMSAGHGGQVLLSHATVARLGRLEDVAILPLGRFRVRDFDEPVQLFELAGDGLPRSSRPCEPCRPTGTTSWRRRRRSGVATTTRATSSGACGPAVSSRSRGRAVWARPAWPARSVCGSPTTGRTACGWSTSPRWTTRI